MREAIFRGLDVLTGEWVKGSVVQVSKMGAMAIATIDENGHLNLTEVDREAVGQFTCLKDKNGVEIYEGDILGAFDEEPLYVEYVEERGAFCFIDKFDPYGLETYTAKDISYNAFGIIGNIYQHSELLEVQHDSK